MSFPTFPPFIETSPHLFSTSLALISGPLSLPRNTQSPGEPRNKRMRRMSSTEEEMDLGVARESKPTVGTEVTYYGQSPASLSSQTSWHSDVEHGKLNCLNLS